MAKIIYDTKQFNGKYNSEEELREAIIAEVSIGHNVAINEEDVQMFFNELNMGDQYIYSRVEQSFTVDGVEEEGSNWIPTYEVRIESSYVDSGSEDYIYTISVFEN